MAESRDKESTICGRKEEELRSANLHADKVLQHNEMLMKNDRDGSMQTGINSKDSTTRGLE